MALVTACGMTEYRKSRCRRKTNPGKMLSHAPRTSRSDCLGSCTGAATSLWPYEAQGPACGNRGGGPRILREAMAPVEADNDQDSSRVQEIPKRARADVTEMVQGRNSNGESKPPSGNAWAITSPSITADHRIADVGCIPSRKTLAHRH